MSTRPKQPNTPELRDAIRRALDAKNVSASAGARLAGVSPSTVLAILSGERDPTQTTLDRLGAGLSTDFRTSAAQGELDLQIEEEFMAVARVAISEHLRKARGDLGANGPKLSRIIGTVGLRLEATPGATVYERVFSLPMRRRLSHPEELSDR